MFQQSWHAVFLRSDAAATILLNISVLLFEGCVYFFGKSAHTNNDWIRYVQWRLLDAVSSKRVQPLSPAVSREKSHTTRTALVLVICICARVQNIVAAAAIWGQFLVCSELLIVRLLLKGGVYSKKYGVYFFYFPQNLYLLAPITIWSQWSKLQSTIYAPTCRAWYVETMCWPWDCRKYYYYVLMNT